MVNNKKGCCEGTGYEEEPIKNSEENEKCCCGNESTANNPEKAEENVECCCESESPVNNNDKEEDTGCGCGCGATEYPDESLINNPDKPKVIADDNFIKAFEDVAHSKGIRSIGYTQLTPELLIKDKYSIPMSLY